MSNSSKESESKNAILNVHLRDGFVYLVNGGIFKIKRDNQISRFSIKQAEAIALKEFKGQGTIIHPYERGTKVWVPMNGNFRQEFKLAYKFEISTQLPLKRGFIYIDVESGSVLWIHNRIHEIGVDGTAKTKYSGTQNLKIDSVNASNYKLIDNTHGNGIITKNLNRTSNYSGATDFTNTTKSWTDTSNNKHAAYDIHWGTQKVYEYYKNIHNRNGIDNANMQMESYYPYNTNFVNAFWDGSKMTYGEGDPSQGAGPLTSIDVVGHEITHGVTQYTAALFIHMNMSIERII